MSDSEKKKEKVPFAIENYATMDFFASHHAAHSSELYHTETFFLRSFS